MIAPTTPTVTRKNAQSPDEVRALPHGHADFVRLEDRRLTRITLDPGWRWSRDFRSRRGTPLCQVAHLEYVVSGRLMVEMEDKTQLELAPGDFVLIPPGHDAWVVGEEPFVAVDLGGAGGHASAERERISSTEAQAIIGY